ncbi:hypothetical protein [Pandoravirus japonicus]|uniref:Uncharacterized protein n=1 Tax=Pandoravirus japonicus TaxID=2823154 RepID=A0A811BQ10_9VIRU|nr:hypothetical protein [Pandoravirus japonicus]
MATRAEPLAYVFSTRRVVTPRLSALCVNGEEKRPILGAIDDHDDNRYMISFFVEEKTRAPIALLQKGTRPEHESERRTPRPHGQRARAPKRTREKVPNTFFSIF